jgi:hypothetical protein
MQPRSTSSSLLIYIGAAATALSVTIIGLTAVVRASTGWSQASAREKTVLELQIESSRSIRRALATPVVTPPLPPITARPARDIQAVANQEKKPPRAKLPQAAMNAMAMDQSSAYQSAAPSYRVPDRHALH